MGKLSKVNNGKRVREKRASPWRKKERGIYTPPRKRAVADRGVGYSDISQNRIIRLRRIIRFDLYRIFRKTPVRIDFKVLSRNRAILRIG